MKAPKRDELLLKLGKAVGEAGAAAGLIDSAVSPTGVLTYQLNRVKLQIVRRREGRYLLRMSLIDYDPDSLWRYYMQLVFVEDAFRTLKGDLATRPVYHNHQYRIKAQLFVAFLAYCLPITLRQQLRGRAGGLDAARRIRKTRHGANVRRARAHDRRTRVVADPSNGPGH